MSHFHVGKRKKIHFWSITTTMSQKKSKHQNDCLCLFFYFYFGAEERERFCVQRPTSWLMVFMCALD